MRLIEQSVILENCDQPDHILTLLERAGKTCYRSQPSPTKEGRIVFIQKLIKSGHESVLEHVSLSVRIVTSRSVTHELVRHRLASYSQQSQRYVTYNDFNGVTFIKPVWYDKQDAASKFIFNTACQNSEAVYKNLIEDCNWLPQQAREILPNCTATELVMTANLREWRHIFKMRTTNKAHPQIKELMQDTLALFYDILPSLFKDIYSEYN